MATEEHRHIALALKYRPMTFDDVVGQEHVVHTLRHAIESNRVANAYLFIGSRGIGKTTLSRIFAKALNCTSPKGVEPCGECTNCQEIAQGRSIDVTELDAASHNKVEDVRPIIESVQFKPTSSRYRIYIIDECHMLSPAAWNALLKTLEEPPPHVRFIFATTEADKVLPTIISRCQRFDLRRIQAHDIVSRLKRICGLEGIDAEEDALLAIARGAEGGMRDALSSLDQLVSFRGTKVTEADVLGVFGLVSRSALEGLAGAILKGDTAAILQAIDTFDSSGKNMRRISGELLQHFRNLVVLQALGSRSKALVATPEQIKVLEDQARGLDPGRVFRVCDQIAEMEDRLRYVLSVRTIMEMCLIRASRLATTATIEELMRAVRALKGGGGAASNVASGVRQAPPAPLPQSSPSPVRSARLEDSLPMPDGLPTVPMQAPVSAAAPVAAAPRSAPAKPSQEPVDAVGKILDDPKINAILEAIPGSFISDIKEKGR